MPTPEFHPDDIAWVRANSRPVTTAVGLRSADVPDLAVLLKLTELRAELTAPLQTVPTPTTPRWQRWGPHTTRTLAMVRPEKRGWHLPVVIHQLIGGKHWSLAVITVGPYTKDREGGS